MFLHIGIKMKKLNGVTLLLLSGTALAEQINTNVVVTSMAEPIIDTVLPQLSFEAQQVRAAELAKQAEYILQQEKAKRLAAEKFAETQRFIQQEIGANRLLLSESVTKIYNDNDLKPMWSNKEAEKRFLKEYALFAISGVSSKSAKALQQILNASEGMGRDILLTDSFLDYLYYHRNVHKFANDWLYNLGTYSPKAPAEGDVAA